MILDSSAIVAVLKEEVGYEPLLSHLAEPGIAVGAPTLVETAMVLGGSLGQDGVSLLSRFVRDLAVAIVPFGPDHWPVAAEAFLKYGRGRHPARLNFGDCLTYATAKLAGEPLLCLGGDFAQTDLQLVL